MKSHRICLLIVPRPVHYPGARPDSQARVLREHAQQRISDSLSRAQALLDLYPNHESLSSLLSDVLCDLYHCAEGSPGGPPLDVVNAVRLARQSHLEDRWCAFGSDADHGLIEDLDDLAAAAECGADIAA